MKKDGIKAISLIIAGSLLALFNVISDGWGATVTAIIGFVFFFWGLSKLKSILDDKGKSAVTLLIVAAIIGIVAAILDIIPLIGGIIAGILLLIAFIIELIGFFKLKKSETIGESGAKGVNLILVSMLLIIIGVLFDLLPLPVIGGIIASILSIISLVLILLGWIKVQEGIVEKS